MSVSLNIDTMRPPVENMKPVDTSSRTRDYSHGVFTTSPISSEPLPIKPTSLVRNTPTPFGMDDSFHSEYATLHSPIQQHHDEEVNTSDSAILSQPIPESRYRPNSTSSFLLPLKRFTGIQSSESQQYNVSVEIQNVDFDNSFLCGYLEIEGLAKEHPTLTTYFEAEIIGSKYSFITDHPEWKCTEKLDMEHWGRFPAFRNYARDAKKPGFVIRNWENKEHIWMRWKEYFLVPDHRVKDLAGASFEGFYYVCFNQITGDLKGIYYHAKSPK
jgi:glucose-induced degradation protein 4